MATVIEPGIEPKTETTPGEKRFLLNNVAWETYRVMVEDPGLSGVRMTYDQGALELMLPSPRHEVYKKLIGRFVELYTLELQIPIMSCGSTTFAREMLKRGLEADESYYVQHETQVGGGDDLDLERDPPPDLAIEVEITQSIVNKLNVYSALKVPEVWRFDGKKLVALILRDDGQYIEQETSAAFPDLPLPTLAGWIQRRKTTRESTLLAEFQQWVRENLSGDESE